MQPTAGSGSRRRAGQSLLEYGIILSLVSIVAAAGLYYFSNPGMVNLISRMQVSI